MIDLLTAWLLLPLLLGVVAFGIGLAADRLSGGRIPGVLLLPLGIAGVIVVGQFAAVAEPTAGLATPACIVLALARSEERRVGKEGRSRGAPYHQKKK